MSYLPIDPANLTPGAHQHAASDITSGTLDVARVGTGTPNGRQFLKDDGAFTDLGSGTPDGSKFLRDDLVWASPPGGGGGIRDGDKGDITVSGGGTTWTVDNSAITYAKIQNVSATDKILGRATAGAGVVEEITCTSQARQLLDDTSFSAMRTTLQLGTLATTNAVDLSSPSQVTNRLPYTNLPSAVAASRLMGRGSAAGAGDFQEISLGSNLSMSGTTLNASVTGAGISDGDYGDITVSGSGTAMSIDAGVVTYAKMQNASAGNVVLARAAATSGSYSEVALAASRLLGRGSTGDIAAISAGTGLAISGTTLSVSLTNETKTLGADVQLTTSNSWTQALETTTAFLQGVYLITATITFNRVTTTARTYMAKLGNDQVSPTTYASTSLYMPSVNPSSASLSLSTIATVPALGSYKFRLYGLTTAGTASDLIKAALPSNGVGNNATSLSIVRIA